MAKRFFSLRLLKLGVVAAGILALIACTRDIPKSSELIGGWLQQRDGHQQGLMLHPNGQLSLIGFANTQGISWRYEAQSQSLWLETQSNFEQSLFSLNLTDFNGKTLELTGSSPLAGRYISAEGAIATVKGEVRFEPLAETFKSVYLTIVLEDVSKADITSNTLAQQLIKLEAGERAKPFVLAVVKSQLEQERSYAIRALIHEQGRLLQSSIKNYGISPLQPGGVVVELESVRKDAQAEAPTETPVELIGDYRELADGTYLQACDTATIYPVASNQVRQQLSQQYASQVAAKGEPWKVHVTGLLITQQRVNAEGKESVLAIDSVKQTFATGENCE